MQNVFLDSVTTKLRLRFFAINTILCGGVDRVFEGWHGWCAAAPCRCSSGLSTFQSRWEVSAVTQKLCQLPRPVSLTKPWKNSRTARKDERIIELQLDETTCWQEETGRPTSKTVRTSWELSTVVLQLCWCESWSLMSTFLSESSCVKEALQMGACKQPRRQGGEKFKWRSLKRLQCIDCIGGCLAPWHRIGVQMEDVAVTSHVEMPVQDTGHWFKRSSQCCCLILDFPQKIST